MKKWDSYKPNLLDLEQSLFFSDLVKGMHASARVVIFVSRHFARWSKKKERMLIIDRPAEVLNFEQKQPLAMVVFFYFYAVIYLD